VCVCARVLARAQECLTYPKVGFCNHGMARPQVAVGGTAFKYGGKLRIY
jgi:hypothetical protein